MVNDIVSDLWLISDYWLIRDWGLEEWVQYINWERGITGSSLGGKTYVDICKSGNKVLQQELDHRRLLELIQRDFELTQTMASYIIYSLGRMYRQLNDPNEGKIYKGLIHENEVPPVF
jgi:hypothetical protein